MVMKFPIFAFSMLLILPCFAVAESKIELMNTDAANDVAANFSQANYQNSDKKLNAVYVDIMSRLNDAESSRLRKIQRLWIKFKKHHCQNLTQRIKSGVGNYNDCLAALTEDRTNELIRIKKEMVGEQEKDKFTRMLEIINNENYPEARMIVKLSTMYLTETDWRAYVDASCKFVVGSMSIDLRYCKARLNFLRSY
jgi:uncharacterized protein YecT (DUF1311 family)